MKEQDFAKPTHASYIEEKDGNKLLSFYNRGKSVALPSNERTPETYSKLADHYFETKYENEAKTEGNVQ